MIRRTCSASRTASDITVSRAGESKLSSCDASRGAARIDAAISNACVCVFSIGLSLACAGRRLLIPPKGRIPRAPFQDLAA